MLISLVAGPLLLVTYTLIETFGGDPAFGTQRYGTLNSRYGLSAWCSIIAIWGFGTPALSYAN